MKKLLKVLITTLCVLGILFVVVVVPFTIGAITNSLLGYKDKLYGAIWVIGVVICTLLFFVFFIGRNIYEGIYKKSE